MQTTTAQSFKKNAIRFKYKPKFIKLFLLIILLAFFTYICINDVIHNDRGLIINGIIHFSPRGATAFYALMSLFSICALLLLIVLFYTNITTKKEIFVFDSQINLPKNAFSKEMISIKHKHIFNIKIRTIKNKRALLIAHRDGTTVVGEEMLESKEKFEDLIKILAVYNSV